MIHSAMIMAAGLGTRLQPYTEQIPKPFVPIMGIPAIQFVVDTLADAGVNACVLNSHHLHQQAVARVQQLDWHALRVHISDESQQLLGSGGGIVTAASKLDDDHFFLANADVLYDLDWRALALKHHDLRQRFGVRLTLALTRRPRLAGAYRGIQVQKTRHLAEGLGAPTETDWFYAGAAVVEKDALLGLHRNVPYEFVPAILEPALRENKVGVHFCEALWLDVGSPVLWAQTHFSLMETIENASSLSLPLGRSFSLWRQRIEGINRRHAPGIWSDRRFPLHSGADWYGPVYCSGPVDRSVALGPSWVSYGALSGHDMRSTKDAILWNGIRSDLQPDSQWNRHF